jgi:hypothetical protein
MRRCILFGIYALAVVLSCPVLSQSGNQNLNSTGSSARYHWVEEGIFDLELGKTIDITDRRVILNLPTNYISEPDQVMLKVNGAPNGMRTGDRFNLKSFGPTAQVFEDMKECYMDLLNITVPKGSKKTATFRFICH